MSSIEIQNILKSIIKEYDDAIVLESSRFLRLSEDRLRNKYPEVVEIIKLGLNLNVPQKLYDLINTDEHGQLLGMKVILSSLAKYHNEKTSYEMLNCFANLLGFKPITMTPKIGSIMPFCGYEWRVLDIKNGKALIISEEIIEMKEYHFTDGDITWEQCELRSYLNGAFYNSLGQEKSRIIEDRVENKNNPWYGTKGGNDTSDKIFLLSLDEVCRYFGDSTANLKKIDRIGSSWSIRDNNDTARIAKDSSGEASLWWLRSPGNYSHSAANVNSDGHLDMHGIEIWNPWYYGLRPALWLNLDASPQANKRVNNGTIIDPNVDSIYSFAGRSWRVLDVKNGNALIISEEIIENNEFCSSSGDITWEKCELRDYLNGAFYNSLGQEKTRIIEHRIENKNNPWYGTQGGNDTHDKIFLLSIDEVCRYFGDSTDTLKKRGRTGTTADDYFYINDNNNSARIAKVTSGKMCSFLMRTIEKGKGWWWLRSPGNNNDRVAYVCDDGCVIVGSFMFSAMTGGGVRPALWLKLEN